MSESSPIGRTKQQNSMFCSAGARGFHADADFVLSEENRIDASQRPPKSCLYGIRYLISFIFLELAAHRRSVFVRSTVVHSLVEII